MSYVGTGDEDWVELDFDLFERSAAMRLDAFLVDRRQEVAAVVGADFEVESTADGLVFLVVEGARRFRVEVGRNDRLILTSVLDPEGPL